MFRVAYRSTLNNGVGEAEIESIAERSAQKNAQAGVTGVWLLSGLRCLSGLEGDPRIVRQLVEDIWDDRRHDDFALVAVGARESGLFDWPFRLIRAKDLAQNPALLGHDGVAWLCSLDGGADGFFSRTGG